MSHQGNCLSNCFALHMPPPSLSIAHHSPSIPPFTPPYSAAGRFVSRWLTVAAAVPLIPGGKIKGEKERDFSAFALASNVNL